MSEHSWTHPEERPPTSQSWATSILLHSVLLAVGIGLGAKGYEEYEPPIPQHVMVSMVAMPRPKNELPDRPMIRPPDPGKKGKVKVKPPEPDRPVLPEPDLPPEAGKEDPEPEPQPTPPPEPTPRRNLAQDREDLLKALRDRLPVGPQTRLPTDPDGDADPKEVRAGTPGAFNTPLSKYQRDVDRRVKDHWHITQPQVLKDNPDLVVVLRVKIADDGRIEKFDVKESSGHPSFDAWAKSAVFATKQLPVPPDELAAEAAKGIDIRFTAEAGLR